MNLQGSDIAHYSSSGNRAAQSSFWPFLHPFTGPREMMIQASFNPVQTDQGYDVVISGRVFDAISNQSVPNAVLSIQVIDPQGTSVHVAIAYSTQNGLYQDSFLLSSTSLGGNYTAFLVADKPGYDTAHLTLTLPFRHLITLSRPLQAHYQFNRVKLRR